MDPFKDTTKTNLLLQQQQQSSSSNPQKKNTQNPLIISLIILLTLIIAAKITASTVLTIRQFSRTDNSVLRSNPSESIRVVCSFTPYKRLCRTTLSSSIAANNNSDYPLEVTPEQIISLSLQLTVTQLTHLSSLPKILNSKPNDQQSGSALLECLILFDKEMSRLNNLVASMDMYALTDGGVVNELVGWLRAVGTHQQACIHRLEENGSAVLDEVRSKVKYTRKYVSNTLAILANTDIISDIVYGLPVEDYSYSIDATVINEYAIVCILQYVFLVFLLSLMLRLY